MDLEYTLQEITPRTMMLTTEYSNAGAIALNNYVVAIDPTMFPVAALAFRADLERKFDKPVNYLIITHYHADHVFGMAPFIDTTIIGSTKLKEGIEMKLASQWTPQAFDDWIKEEPDKMDDIRSIEVVLPKNTFDRTHTLMDEDLHIDITHGGGHTAGSAYAYFPAEKVLVAGDLLFAEYFPWAGDPTCNPDEWIKAFEQILKLDIVKVIPGHGPVAEKEELTKHLLFFQELREATQEAIEVNKSPEDIAVPEFYAAAENWIIPETLKHWWKFYGGQS